MIRIGTRGSKLALAQAAWVAEQLGEQSELITVSSSGPGEDKSRWVSHLERALLEDEIDVAVHSAKDVPSDLLNELELIAFPQREDPRDGLIGADSLAALAQRARVGTSSLRRAAQLLAIRPDLEIVPVTGNVDTRLRKLADGECDALVLARAGLVRLARQHEIGAVLDELVPAAGQGALALEARPGALPEEALARVSDPATTACVRAERELVRALEASCNTPVGAYAQLCEGGELELRAWAGLPNGSEWVSDIQRGPADGLGAAVARRLLAVGAGELLSRAEREHAA